VFRPRLRKADPWAAVDTDPVPGHAEGRIGCYRRCMPAAFPLAPAEVPTTLPSYAPALNAYHRAFWPELSQMMRELEVPSGSTVLDLACGVGSYLLLLTQQTRAGALVGIDLDPAFLRVAADTVSGLPAVTLLRGDALALPYEDGALDFVWCAQSLYSLPDPSVVLREIFRVLKPGGKAAILENDTLHHLLMPWPVELEIDLRRAEYQAFGDDGDDPRRFYVARNLLRLFNRAGFESTLVRTYVHNRQPPFSEDELVFFEWYFSNLRERIVPFLPPRVLEAFDRLVDRRSPNCLLHSEHTIISCIDHVVTGTRPQTLSETFRDASR
jgi:SAM-dependent methyltransferase